MVVPKDQSDSYTISRKVILTDTEGQAHAQDNGCLLYTSLRHTSVYEEKIKGS